MRITRYMKLKTPEEVKEEFYLAGDSVSEWAMIHGFPPSLVYRVLRSKDLPRRGKSHDIAVKLGMKHGTVSAIRAKKQPGTLVTTD